MPWFRYRTIRSQLTIGFIVLELAFTVCFSLLILRTEVHEIHGRSLRRIEQQVNLLATMATDAMIDQETHRLVPMSQALEASTSVHFVRLTDPHGAPLLPNTGHIETSPLSATERKQLPAPGQSLDRSDVFQNEEGNREAVQAVRNGDVLLGYAWVAENPTPEREEVEALVRITVIAGVLGALGCLLASALLARSITRPLHIVMNATRRLIRDPETKEGFPLEVAETNEAGELAQAFNLLVLSMEEQRSGLNDTLALLDSMLAHAPIGFAFLDRQFAEQYPPERRCADFHGGGCWRPDRTAAQDGFAFSADGIFERGPYSRRVTGIDFSDPIHARLGVVNEGIYNWSDDASDISRFERDRRSFNLFNRYRLTAPLFIVYRFPAAFAGSTLCWRGDVLWEGPNERFDVLNFTLHRIWGGIAAITSAAAIVSENGELVREMFGQRPAWPGCPIAECAVY